MRQFTGQMFEQDENGNPTGGKSYIFQMPDDGTDDQHIPDGVGCVEIPWQDGPLGNPPDAGKINGCFVEGVIQAAIDRLMFFNSSRYRCRENSLAITKLEEALHWLDHRTAKRKVQGVEGLHKTHEE